MTETLEFKPFPKQAEFAAIPTSIKEGFFGGAAGPGKSIMLLMDPILRGLHNYPRFHGIIFRETYKQIEESLALESQHYYGPYAKYNAQEHCWTFNSGAKIRFGYLERDDQVYKHDTAQYNYGAFDELTAFSRFRYMYIVHSRLRTTVGNLPAYSRSASNPLGIGHAWVKARFITPCKTGGKILKETIINPVTKQAEVVKRIFISAKVTDNPELMKNNPTYVNSLMLLPEAEKRSKLYGDWDAIGGQVFTEFRTLRMIDEPENALHVCKPFEIPEYWPVILSIDWGYDHMTYACFLGISPDERVYLAEEKSWVRTKVAIWAPELAVAAAKYKNLKTPVTLDRSAWNDRGDEKTLAEQIEEHLGLSVEKADNDRIGGKQLIHEYLRFTPKPPRYIPKGGYSKEIEDILYRRKGEQAAKDYARLFEPEPPETNLPKLQIFENCPLFQEALVACVSDPKRPEDVLKFDGDDPYDGGRYGLKRVHKYFTEATEAYKAIKRRDSILEEYHRTGDMTTLYRQMEKLESDALLSQKAVRRVNSLRGMRRYRAAG